MLRKIAIVAGALTMGACTHVQLKRDEDAVRALEEICAYGAANAKIEGAVWIKAESPDAKGQFPAEIEARAPDQVFMEVTNLIGETQARIKVDSGSYRIDVQGRQEQAEEGGDSWGGIPLEWAASLFLGRFPCPTEVSHSKLSVRREADDVIVAERRGGNGEPLEEFFYHVKSWGGKAWPERLQWTRAGSPPASVTFKFEKPDSQAGAPARWEAKSDRGEVEVRWRRRNVEKAKSES